MVFDQASNTKDLRPINLARTVAEDPRISVATTTGRPLEGVFPNPVPETGSPGSIPVFYPATVSDAGFVVPGYGNQIPGVTAWCPRPSAPLGHVGVNPVSGFGYNPNLGSRVVPNAAGQSTSEMVAGFGYTQGLGNRDSGNGRDRLNIDAMNKNLCNPDLGTRSCDMGSEEGGNDSVTGKKAKFLCSFGGKIFPRPSDGMLRYVGGQTRIISVRRDVSFNEFVQKMAETYGQAVVIKYQLPDEDLDALVSVSCPDDLDNMMDEYEKLLERSSDGSSKLRLFLFSASEMESSGVMQFGDLQDSGQRYFEAVNGVTDGITRKESIASASSTQNSDFSGTDAVESSGPSQGDFGMIPAVSILSPWENCVTSRDIAQRTAPVDPSTTVYADAYGLPMGVPVVKLGPPQPEVVLEKPVLQQPGIIPSVHHLPAYVDPRMEVLKQPDYVHPPAQSGFPNPHLLGIAGSVYTQPFHGNAMSVSSSHQLFPSVHMTMTPSSPHVGVRPVVIQPVGQTQDTRLEQHYPDESNTFGAPGVVQLPVEQSYNTTYQAQIAPGVVSGGYGWHPIAPPDNRDVFSDGVVPPHQQVVVPEKFQRLEDCNMCQKALPHAHSDPVVQEKDSVTGSVYHSFHPDDAKRLSQLNKFMGQPRVLSHVDYQFGTPRSEAIGFSQNVAMQYEPEKSALQRDSVGAAQIQASEPFLQETLKEHPGKIPAVIHKENNVDPRFSPDHLRQIGGLMENLRICSPEMYFNGDNYMPPTDKTCKEAILNSRPQQIAGMDMLLHNTFSQSPVVPDTSQVVPTEILSNTRVEVSAGHASRPMESSGPVQSQFLGNPGLYQHSALGTEVHYGNPAYSVVESAFGADRVPPVLDCKDDALSVNLPSSLSSSTGAGNVQDSSNSLFSNQDPWNLQPEIHPPRPNKIQIKKEAFGAQDHFDEKLSVLSGVSNSEAHLQGGILQLLSNSNKDLKAEHVRSSKGSEEEYLKKELQNVAEGVAASVFQSNTASNPELPVQMDESASDANRRGGDSHNDVENKHTTPFEDIRSKLPERLNFGFPVSDSLGRLQIIKDSDLEELRELGSGTFGTVYHGKWRGTDVAIKRINDRCFAGKASEQEKMIDDFWNEAIKLADLHHPNVVAFYGVVLDSPGGSVATVTEYMVNGSLRNALQKNVRNLDKRKRLLIAMDVAFGMEYLHGKNIVHFDLKSDNLLVNLRDPHRPICKVGDLGLSKVKCQTLISGGVRGTLPWMAPELLNGSSSLVSEKVDVFSFGIVLWELLTGEEPYADLHYGAIIGGIVSNTLRPPIPEFCDQEWKSLTERCWSADPSQRPGFTEIANELRSMASKLPSRGQVSSQQT